jgi:hypothetical protein
LVRTSCQSELRQRCGDYGYDNLYRPTSETVASDPNAMNGNVTYCYDTLGNRAGFGVNQVSALGRSTIVDLAVTAN